MSSTLTEREHDIQVISDLFAAIPTLPHRHSRTDPVWRLWDAVARQSIAGLFSSAIPAAVAFGPFGNLSFPYVEMGAINSLDLFGLDELILFSFYYANRHRYRRVVDFGTNIGLHSTIMVQCGFEVKSFEPDPHHIQILKRNLSLNQISVDLHEAAISVHSGEMEFTRVLGNTTGSHLSGAKAAPYGELEHFQVQVEAASPNLAWADLAKIDIEGHEGVLITGLPPEIWTNADAILEIGTAENARLVFEHLADSSVNLFSQKTGWARVVSLGDMPTSHREGSLFLSTKSEMPW
ncbi:FkbM family methyltransferase [Labrys neptuniae]